MKINIKKLANNNNNNKLVIDSEKLDFTVESSIKQLVTENLQNLLLKNKNILIKNFPKYTTTNNTSNKFTSSEDSFNEVSIDPTNFSNNLITNGFLNDMTLKLNTNNITIENVNKANVNDDNYFLNLSQSEFVNFLLGPLSIYIHEFQKNPRSIFLDLI